MKSKFQGRLEKAVRTLMIAGALVSVPAMTFAETKSVAQEQNEKQAVLANKVRHELVMLPYLGVFDNLSYKVEDGVVTLTGQVVRPIMKSDAEGVVKRLEGVRQVVNNIEVLPLSPFDDRIRFQVLRAVYGYPTLQRYGMGTQPPIRIVVKNGDVFLEGVVANKADKDVAFLRANGVAGVFTVHNNLRVEKNS